MRSSLVVVARQVRARMVMVLVAASQALTSPAALTAAACARCGCRTLPGALMAWRRRCYARQP
ncbi:MAG: hypothetical protein ACRDQ4_12955 [Pseudonocardiaceae bacterium]